MRLESRDLPLPPPASWDAPSTPFAPEADLIEAIAAFAVAEPARRQLARLAAGQAFVVVTGQQPCFPLPLGLTLMKTATAVVLARREAIRLGIPVLPLLWNASDDSDFEEAAGQWLPRSSRPSLELSLPTRLRRKGAAVGGLPIADAFDELILLASPPFRPRPGEDLGSFHGRVLSELFAPDGLLVLDARSPAIAHASVALYRRYLERRDAVALAVDEEGERLEAIWGQRPLRKDVARRGLYFLKDGRRRQPAEAGYAAALAARLSGPILDLAPNVALRPLVQDSILPVAAVVLGPSEWRYQLQLRPAFAELGVDFPRPVPRLEAVDSRELGRESPPPGGRRHSPLLEPGSRLAERETLLELAELHLEAWEKNHYHRWIMKEHGET